MNSSDENGLPCLNPWLWQTLVLGTRCLPCLELLLSSSASNFGITCGSWSLIRMTKQRSQTLYLCPLWAGEGFFLACNILVEDWTNLKLSWMVRPRMKALWLQWIKELIFDANLQARTLVNNLPTTWIKEIDLWSFNVLASVDLEISTIRASLLAWRSQTSIYMPKGFKCCHQIWTYDFPCYLEETCSISIRSGGLCPVEENGWPASLLPQWIYPPSLEGQALEDQAAPS
jgi:hypothetical protein